MISASNDSQQQEQLIEKYMSLPNQVWDDIINQAAKNVSTKFPYIVFWKGFRFFKISPSLDLTLYKIPRLF